MEDKMIKLPWFAIFKDGSSIAQFEGNKERLFKEVLERQDELQLFALRKADGLNYIVNLEHGTIESARANQLKLTPRADMLRKTPNNYRLIYFREVERSFGTNLVEIGKPKYMYFIGFQYTDSNGYNQKRIMKINEDGRWIVN